MKILHTSDWHLGQSFFTQTRKHEHQAFLNWLVELVVEEQVDAVIVAGDIFDTGTPPSYARELYNQFVVALQQQKCALLVLGGNHDSVAVLNESKQLLACLNSYVVASTDLPLAEQVILLNDQAGKPGALVCAVPFVRAKDVLQSQAGDTGVAKRQALANAIQQHYQQLFTLAQQLRQTQGWEVPIIATGHLAAMGVSQSESVREIYIGTLDGFAAEGFPPADYIALGHIHRAQRVGKTEHIRYSGSPIPLSFDELNHTKQVLLVEFAGTERQSIREIPIPCFQPMQVLSGDLAAITAQLAQLRPASDTLPIWLCLEVETQDYLTDLPQKIQELTEGLPVSVLQLRRQRQHQRQSLQQQHQETLAELTPEQVFQKRLSLEDFSSEQAQARRQRLEQQFSQVLTEVALESQA